ncbi:MAG: hypothetical protein CMP91_05585 [Gammaproteobacteria bacterium]|nr:hypothetical protein [Gammaproteobacteria bacterium]MAY01468.1 hypothetical protein [Gammaproteobacteria bacterium]|tara:strand:+ start:364 stop:750 length:387 start_codon:yes stop_codon:yes gene_type:complete
MEYEHLAWLHLSTIVPAFLIGTYLLIKRKGSPRHKMLGKFYMSLMLTTGIITLFMPAYIGPQLLNHFGYLHLFSLLVLVSVPMSYLAIRRGDVLAHRNSMIGLYVGGILVAGSIAFLPGRMLTQLLFG